MVVFEDETMHPAMDISQSNIKNWYQSFSTGNTATQVDVKKEVKPISKGLSDLLMYSMQIKAYTSFINEIIYSIEDDIRRDIETDNTIQRIYPNVDSRPAEMPVQAKPLSFAVKNREGLVTAASNVSELVGAIDSILSRIKGIS